MRLYNPDFKPFEQTLLTPRQLHHLSVRRFRPNRETLYIFNDQHGVWKVVFHNDTNIIPVESISSAKKTPKLALAFGLIRSAHLSDFLQKAVELGVTDFFPLQTDFSQTYPLKMDKLEQVMIDAIQQSERLTLPTIHPIIDLKTLCQKIENFTFFSAIERESSHSLFDIHEKNMNRCIVIGPEGGWSLNEKKFLTDHTRPYSLGHSILKVETAMILSIGYCAFLFD